MRVSRLLIVLLAALAAAGCLRRSAPIQYAPYAYGPPPAAQPGYQAQASQTPAPRGLFTQRSAQYRAPVYAAPQPVYQPPCAAPGCAPQAYPPAAAGYPAYAAYPPQGGYLQGYALDAGDRLRITVFGQQGLTNSYAVDAAGFITMPLVGAVPARGLTTEQLAQSISERLRQGYIREPQVAIEIEAYRPFFIHGEVTTPGQYPYVANMTVENAVAIAGGFGPRADQRKITVSRSIGGQTTQGAVGLAYPLRPGDILRVGERWF